MLRFLMDTLTIEQLKQLIASGDDSHDNQLRCTEDGYLFLSQDIVRAEKLNGIAFYYETFAAHNGYVGLNASMDEPYIRDLYFLLVDNWNNGNPKRLSLIY